MSGITDDMLIVVVCSFVLSYKFFDNINPAVAIVAGLMIGVLIGKITEIYTSGDYRHVKKIAEQSQTGSATTIIGGFAVGMFFTVWLIIVVAVGILVANGCAGLYGIALAAVGILSTTGITVTVDAYGPVAVDRKSVV